MYRLASRCVTAPSSGSSPSEREGWATWPANRAGVRRHRRRSRRPVCERRRKWWNAMARHRCFGMTLTSEALAVVPKLADWNAIFVSSDNGDGRLTGNRSCPTSSAPIPRVRWEHARSRCICARRASRIFTRSAWTTPGDTTASACSRTRLSGPRISSPTFIHRSAPRTFRPTSRRSGSPAPMPATS